MWLPWTSGEIYIEEGLEEAMNIDRNSFDLTHPHYRKLKNYLHNLLHEKIFKRVRERYTLRMEEKKKLELKEKSHLLEDLFTRKFGSPFVIEYSKDFDPKHPVDIDVDRKTLTIHRFHPIFRKRKQKRELIEHVLILFEIAYSLHGRDIEKLKDFFLDEIERW
jgi:hypothetical protein